MKKIKSKVSVVHSLTHNTRERMPPNADPEWSVKNWYHGGTTAECLNRFNGLMPEKVRKNAVLAVELVMTASPEFAGDWAKYLNACDRWALETFGIDPTKKDLRPAIHFAHHRDEKTPHTHITIMPLKDGKLNAKFFIGGHKDRMKELQNDFYEKVGKQFGLDRGVSKEETKAKYNAPTLAGVAANLNNRRDNRIVGLEKLFSKDELKIFIQKNEGKTFHDRDEYLEQLEKFYAEKMNAAEKRIANNELVIRTADIVQAVLKCPPERLDGLKTSLKAELPKIMPEVWNRITMSRPDEQGVKIKR